MSLWEYCCLVVRGAQLFHVRKDLASPSISYRAIKISWLVLEIDQRGDKKEIEFKAGKMGWATSLLHNCLML